MHIEADLVCHADLNYLLASGETMAVNVPIHNGRQLTSSPSLPFTWQAAGFERLGHTSKLTDFASESAITSTHYDEMIALAQDLTGCDHALISGHILRNPEQEAVHPDLGPIQFVHSDFAASYGERLRAHYRAGGADTNKALARAGLNADDVCNAKRLLILQFWRNVGPTKMDLPIAFCDARSVPAAQLRAFPVNNYADGGFDFDTLGVMAPRDRATNAWFTFPELTVNEVVAFRTFDTDRLQGSEPYWTPHSAFRDPEVALGQPSRYSIELRATCIFH